MSLLRKIRRRHKAFELKKSAQTINADGAASVGSVEDGEDGDEDNDADVIAGKGDADKVLTSIAVFSMNETPSEKNSTEQGDVSVDSFICIPSYAAKNVVDVNDVMGTKSRLWPRMAKTATLLLVSSGAFYIGKAATVGMTLSLLLVCKLLTRDHIHSSESSERGELWEGSQSDESLRVSHDTIYHAGDEVTLSDESLVRHFIGDDNNGADIDLEVNEYDTNEETFAIIANGDSLLAKRKQLKRLNCIKLPSSTSPFDEAIQESPSSAKASLRTWFRNAGSPENSADFRKQGKFKSKALFRRLRKGGPHSAPSSPLWSDSEPITGFSVIPDGSDSERAIHGPRAMHRKSNFRPASPVTREASGADANLRFLDQQGLEESLASGKGEIKNLNSPLPNNLTIRNDGKMDGCAAAFCKGKMKQQHVNPSLPKEQFAGISSAGTSLEAMTKPEMPSSLVTSQDLQRRRGGTPQPSWKPAASPSVSLEITARGNAAPANSRAAIRERGERKQQKVRVGTAWLTSGLAIIAAGLFMGRIVAVAGLICYWYVLSLVRNGRL